MALAERSWLSLGIELEEEPEDPAELGAVATLPESTLTRTAVPSELWLSQRTSGSCGDLSGRWSA